MEPRAGAGEGISVTVIRCRLPKKCRQRAKFAEAREWVSREVVKALPEEINGKNVSAMKLRWVITWKEEHLKARLVVVGFQDDKLGERQVTSPTMQRRSRGLFAQVCANERDAVCLLLEEYTLPVQSGINAGLRPHKQRTH